MNIPEYMISRPLVETWMERQFQDAPDGGRPEPPRHPRRTTTALRLRLSAAIHAVAAAIDPKPLPECAPGPQG